MIVQKKEQQKKAPQKGDAEDRMFDVGRGPPGPDPVQGPCQYRHRIPNGILQKNLPLFSEARHLLLVREIRESERLFIVYSFFPIAHPFVRSFVRRSATGPQLGRPAVRTLTAEKERKKAITQLPSLVALALSGFSET